MNSSFCHGICNVGDEGLVDGLPKTGVSGALHRCGLGRTGQDGEKRNKSEKTSSFSPSCIAPFGEQRASVDLALNGTLLLGLVCIYLFIPSMAEPLRSLELWINELGLVLLAPGFIAAFAEGRGLGTRAAGGAQGARFLSPWR